MLKVILTSTESDHPAGGELRNPQAPLHTTSSPTGCRIFVKRTQENREDQHKARISTHHTSWRQGHGNLQVMPLFSSDTEGSALVIWLRARGLCSTRTLGAKRFLCCRESSSTSLVATLRTHGSAVFIYRVTTRTSKWRQSFS